MVAESLRLPELLTVEQVAERLQVSRATLFNWMQKGVIVQGRHYFKRGRVLRFIWNGEFISELLAGSEQPRPKRLQAAPLPSRQKETEPINWEY